MDQMGWRTVGVILDASGRPRKRYQPRAVNFILASGTKTDSFPNLPHGTPMGYLRGSGEDLMGSGGHGGRLTDNGNVTPCPSRRSGPAACLPAALNQWGGQGGGPGAAGGHGHGGPKGGRRPPLSLKPAYLYVELFIIVDSICTELKATLSCLIISMFCF